jgi:putative nucleotidyltransferase with HDIG domain
VLLVDDDVNILHAYKLILRKKFRVLTATSGSEGLALMESEGPFALIISDYKMPQMDGVEFLAAAKTIAPETFRIILTGKSDLETAVEAINRGNVFRFLTKPCPSDRLIATITEAINQYNLVVNERKSLEEQLNKYSSKVIKDFLQAVSSLLVNRDPYTAIHQERVAELAGAIARKLGLPHKQIDAIEMSASVHDIGKMFVPAEILSKPGKISDIEYALIKTHSQVGCDILKSIESPFPIAKIVLQHHERQDGSGYPAGLAGKDILLESRIIAVADVVEAMSSYRPYRPSLGLDTALQEIIENKNILYDPDVVDACISVINDDQFNFRK